MSGWPGGGRAAGVAMNAGPPWRGGGGGGRTADAVAAVAIFGTYGGYSASACCSESFNILVLLLLMSDRRPSPPLFIFASVGGGFGHLYGRARQTTGYSSTSCAIMVA